MILTLVKNEAPKPNNIRAAKSRTDSWFVGHDEPQSFVLRIQTENLGEKGKYVGLIQTVLSGERLVTYTAPAGDNRVFTWRLRSNRDAPVLDSTNDLRPWFSQDSEAKGLPEPGKSIELKIIDKPSCVFPTALKENDAKNAKEAHVAHYHASDEFLISLVFFDETDKVKLYKMKADMVETENKAEQAEFDKDAVDKKPTATQNERNAAAAKATAARTAATTAATAYAGATLIWNSLVKKQWIWRYEYKIKADKDGNPTIDKDSVKFGEAQEVQLNAYKLVAHGDTATAQPYRKEIVPVGWKAIEH